MVKTAVQRKPTAPVAQDDIELSLKVLAAKRQFISASLTMGWQMAGMVIIPVAVGAQLDSYLKTAPMYTLASLAFAVGGAIFIVSRTIKQVNLEQNQHNRGSFNSKGAKF